MANNNLEGATLMTPSEALENCAECRIEISTTGIEIDGQDGNLMFELGILVLIGVFFLFSYAGYRWIKKKYD